MRERYTFQDYQKAKAIILRAEDEPELLEDPDFRVRYDWAKQVVRRFEAGLS